MKKGDNIRYISLNSSCLTHNKIYKIHSVNLKYGNIHFLCNQGIGHTEQICMIKKRFILMLNINNNIKIL